MKPPVNPTPDSPVSSDPTASPLVPSEPCSSEKQYPRDTTKKGLHVERAYEPDIERQLEALLLVLRASPAALPAPSA